MATWGSIHVRLSMPLPRCSAAFIPKLPAPCAMACAVLCCCPAQHARGGTIGHQFYRIMALPLPCCNSATSPHLLTRALSLRVLNKQERLSHAMLRKLLQDTDGLAPETVTGLIIA